MIIKFYLLFITLLIMASFTLGFFNINSSIVDIIIIISVVILLVRYFYPLLISVNIGSIENFLLKNKKNPLLHFIYATANNLNEEAEESYIKLLMKYQNSNRQAIYKTEYALFKKDSNEANANVHLIKHLDYKLYYEALIAIIEGDFNKVRLNSKKIKSAWMKETILAEMYLKENNMEKAKEYATLALLKTRGLQRYTLYKNFETLIGIVNVNEHKLASRT
jgi:hypothetical protein